MKSLQRYCVQVLYKHTHSFCMPLYSHVFTYLSEFQFTIILLLYMAIYLDTSSMIFWWCWSHYPHLQAYFQKQAICFFLFKRTAIRGFMALLTCGLFYWNINYFLIDFHEHSRRANYITHSKNHYCASSFFSLWWFCRSDTEVPFISEEFSMLEK